MRVRIYPRAVYLFRSGPTGCSAGVSASLRRISELVDDIVRMQQTGSPEYAPDGLIRIQMMCGPRRSRDRPYQRVRRNHCGDGARDLLRVLSNGSSASGFERPTRGFLLHMCSPVKIRGLHWTFASSWRGSGRRRIME